MRPSFRRVLSALRPLPLLITLAFSTSALAERRLADLAPSDVCFLDVVVVVDLGAQSKGTAIDESMSTAAEAFLTKTLRSQAPGLPLQETVQDRSQCLYSGVVGISLFPEKDGHRFLIARYFLNLGRLDRSALLQSLAKPALATDDEINLDIEVFGDATSSGELPEQLQASALQALKVFLAQWQKARGAVLP